MIVSKQCPKCGSEEIAGPHRIHGDGHLSIDLPGLPTATLESFTCAHCGYTEFYVDRIGLENVRQHGRYVLNVDTPHRCQRCGFVNAIGATICHECGSIL